MEPRRNRGVRCIRFVRRRCAHLSKNLRPTFSRAASDVRTQQCAFEFYPQNTQTTRKTSASICVFCGQKILFITSKDAESPNDPSSATRPTRAFACNLDAMAGFAAAHG